MTNVEFTQFTYYPALQCSVEEHMAYQQLSDDDKNAILPIFELSQRGTEPDLNSGIGAVKESAGERPFILDLCKDLAPSPYIPRGDDISPEYKAKIPQLKEAQEKYNSLLAELLDPADGFRNWRALVSRFPNAIPMLQYKDAKSEHRHILRQAAKLSRNGGCLAIRVTDGAGDEIISSIAQVLAILADDQELLVIIDCGQGRVRIAERAQFTRRFVNAVINEIDVSQWDQVEFVCLSSSFSESGKEELHEYPGYEWEIWEQAAQDYSMMFGDYGAHYRRKRTTTYVPSDWKPLVVFPLDKSWIMYRHENTKDPEGWKKGAKAVKSHASYSPLTGTWGQTILDRATNDDIEGISQPRFWRAAKSNMHMHRQIRCAPGMIAELLEASE